MNQQEYLQEFKRLTETMYETTKAKNSDYTGGNNDAFKNFTMVEVLGVASTEQGFVTRMVDKIMRISGFVKNGALKVRDEKVEDTLMDLAVYCLLMICYLRDQKDLAGTNNNDTSYEGFNVPSTYR